MAFFEEVLRGLDYRKAAFSSRIIRDENWLSGNVKERKIYIQNETMVHLQKHLLTWLRKQEFKHSYVTGASKGSSPFKHILAHRVRHAYLYRTVYGEFPRFFYSLDLKDAYQSVNLFTLANILSMYDLSLFTQVEELFVFLFRFCSGQEKGLAPGATASPDLFNLYCGVIIDTIIGMYCKMHDITYTRYLDDLLFSSQKPIGKKHKSFIKKIIKHARFQINDKKTRSYDLRKGTVVINGVGVKINGMLFLPRKFTDQLRGMLHKVLSGKGNDIPEQVIRGKMNLFLYSIKGRTVNSTERKLNNLCCRYLNLQKELKKASK